MNLQFVATQVPDVNVTIEAASADPTGWIIALVVAGISITGTIWVAWYSHNQAHKSWLKDQRREVYTLYRRQETKLNGLIREGAARRDGFEEWGKRLRDLQNERVEMFASIQMVASPEVQQAIGIEEIAFNKVQELGKDVGFVDAQDKLTAAMANTAAFMSRDLGVRTMYKDQKQKSMATKMRADVDELAKLRTARRKAEYQRLQDQAQGTRADESTRTN